MSKTIKFSDGDMVIDRNKGRAIYISGTEKASQDMAFFLLTPTDSIRRVGCGLRRIDQVQREQTMTKMLIQQEATNAVQRLQAWQLLDPDLTDAERITGIDSITVIPESVNSFLFNMAVTVATEDAPQLGYRILLGQQFQGLTRNGIPGLVTDDNRPIV